MKRPDELTREYLRRLEEQLLNNKDVFRLMNTIYLNEILDEKKDKKSSTGRIGIWKKANGQYVLDETTAAEWNFWSKMTSIPEKGEKKRVLFLGESVARGYFYDPFYNPCKELNDLFQTNGKDGYEVIDLARTDLNYNMLIQLIEEAKQLEPDAVVIFGGNNWDCSELWTRKPLEVAERLKNGGMKTVLDYFNQSLMEQVKNLYSCLNELYIKHEIPVVFVIPEFNLLDWEDTDMGLPWDADTNHAEWLNHMERLQKLFQENNYEQVIREALEHSDLDKKLSTRELNLLAKAYRASGNREEEQNCKKRAKDIAILYPKISTPRTVTVVQEALRKEAENCRSLVIVDSGKIFRRESKYINREFFMDYCHLTMHGIQLVMGEVFQKLLDLTQEHVTTSVDTKTCGKEENSRVQAEAHFLAAIHNAHWGQGAEIVKYHLQKACEFDGEMKSILKEFAFFQNRTLPVWMSKNAEEYLNGISEQRQRYLSKNKGLVLDKILTECIKEIVSDDEFNVEIEMAINKTYGVHESAKNLLDPDYYVKAISMSEAQYNWPEIPARLKRYGYYAAYSDTSSFCFVTDKAKEFVLRLVGRIPGEQSNNKVLRILLNGAVVYEGKIAAEWSKFEVEISVDSVSEGYNELQLQWPDYSVHSAEQMEQMAEVLEKRRVPEIIPIFGEIYTLLLENKEHSCNSEIMPIE